MTASAGETGEGQGSTSAEGGGEDRTFTQSQLNAILAQQKREIEGKFEGFDEIRSKAEQFDALTETDKTEAQRAKERADQLQQENESFKAELAWRDTLDKHRTIAAKHGLDSSLIEFVKGETDEEIEASVKKLAGASSPRRATGLRSGSSSDSNSEGARRQRIAEMLRQVGTQ